MAKAPANPGLKHHHRKQIVSQQNISDMKVPFTKMQGLGNDFMVLDLVTRPIRNPMMMATTAPAMAMMMFSSDMLPPRQQCAARGAPAVRVALAVDYIGPPRKWAAASPQAANRGNAFWVFRLTRDAMMNTWHDCPGV